MAGFAGSKRRRRPPFDPSNPRRHSRQQIRAIARSVKGFGWLIPILVDAANRTIAGHGRYEAGRLRLESVPVIRAEYLTREQAKAFMLADDPARGRFRLGRHQTGDRP